MADDAGAADKEAGKPAVQLGAECNSRCFFYPGFGGDLNTVKTLTINRARPLQFLSEVTN